MLFNLEGATFFLLKKKEGKENFNSGFAARGVCLYLQTWKRDGKIPMSLLFGGVAQLGEHLPCKQGVRSSILLISTTFNEVAGSRQQRERNRLHGLIAQVVRAHA